MSNPNFIATFSTNEIWRDLDDTRCLTDDLDAIESDIVALETGKADTNHSHSNYSETTHTHSDYAELNHGHNNYALTEHTHSGYADENHTHDEYAEISHEHSGYADTNHNHNTVYAGINHTHDTGSTLLWSGNNGNGGYYMTDGHTVTPSKKLSECRNGWMLLWSRYDPSTNSVKNDGFCTTMIPKIAPTGANWVGHSFTADVVGNYSTTSPYTDTRFMKWLYVWDNKLVGRNFNDQGGRNTVVLRAVYEF